MTRRILAYLAPPLTLGILFWVFVVTTANPQPIPPDPPAPCSCISHVDRKDSTYFECQCLRGHHPVACDVSH